MTDLCRRSSGRAHSLPDTRVPAHPILCSWWTTLDGVVGALVVDPLLEEEEFDFGRKQRRPVTGHLPESKEPDERGSAPGVGGVIMFVPPIDVCLKSASARFQNRPWFWSGKDGESPRWP